MERLSWKDKVAQVFLAGLLGTTLYGCFKEGKEKENIFFQNKPLAGLNRSFLEAREETSVLPVLDQRLLSEFYQEGIGVVSYKSAWLSDKEEIVSKIKEWWQPQDELADGRLFYGGFLTAQEISQLLENLPEGLEVQALFVVDIGGREDVFVLTESSRQEQIYLQVVALVTDLEKPKIPTWARAGEQGLTVWQPEMGRWVTEK